jgi:hypothetical protein
MARYHVLGFVPEEKDENTAVLSEGEQRVEGNVVYETDKESEARQIHTQGGFTGQDGRWIVVTGIRDTQETEGEGRKAPLEK